MNRLNSPPEPDEIEISLFGPGYGECSVVHLGNNDWIVIDSCLEPSTKQSIALHYFQQLGIDVSEHVSMIIASHWHDDHVRGLSSLVAACPNAKLVLSLALKKEEFAELINTYNSDRIRSECPAGCDEMSKVSKILKEREDRSERAGQRHIFAVSGRLLRPGKPNSKDIAKACEIWSLSPSDSAIMASIQDIAGLIPNFKGREGRGCLLPISSNRASVVIFIKLKGHAFLFGADLENTGTGMGWDMICSPDNRPNEHASFFKVPHHGSITGHCDQVWSEMLITNVVASLTPFEKGNVILPKPRDIERLNSLTSNAFITANTGIMRTPRRHHTVQRTIKEATTYIRQTDPSFGHFRYRLKNGGTPSIELFGDTRHL